MTHLAGPVDFESGARHGHGARLEVADQPRARAGGARHRERYVDDQRRAAQPRHRPDDRRAAGARRDGRRRRHRADASAARIAPHAGRPHRLRAGGHGAAVRAAGRGAGHRRPSRSTATNRPAPARSRRCSTRCAASGSTSTATALPFAVRGAGLGAPAATVEIDASASSQFVSGLLLSGAALHRRADDRAHRRAGAVGTARGDDGGDAARRRRRRRRQPSPTGGGSSPGPIAARHWSIEPDLSNAVPFLAAAVVSGGVVRIAGWPRSARSRPTPSSRSSRSWVRLCAMADSYLEVQRRRRLRRHRRRSARGRRADARGGGARRAGRPRIRCRSLRGVAHLRGHETDRLAALSRRDQRPRRPVRGDRRRAGDHRPAAARRGCGGPTPTTGWRPQARSSGCGCPTSRWRTSAPPPRRCPVSRGCGPTCWRARRRRSARLESARVRRVRCPGAARPRLAAADQDSAGPRRRAGGDGGDRRPGAVGLRARPRPRPSRHRHAGPGTGPHVRSSSATTSASSATCPASPTPWPASCGAVTGERCCAAPPMTPTPPSASSSPTPISC